MFTLPTALSTHLAGNATSSRMMVWVVARDRTAGTLHPTGFWTGNADQTINVGGVMRDYRATGGLLAIPKTVHDVGDTSVRTDVTFFARSPELVQAVRVYDVRYAPIEVHKVYMDPMNDSIIGSPVLELRGMVDSVQENRPTPGQTGLVFTFKLIPGTVRFTRKLALRHSFASINQANPADHFGKYFDITARVSAKWG